ncbi:MAG: nitrate reductase cytochrome c-type subunit [Candidatus Accumulibacter sp.]|jgi:cytochrome c-type protein NapB|nr:nitrate reductase cytochrome c-type subunit [Accumulibacter sp.]
MKSRLLVVFRAALLAAALLPVMPVTLPAIAADTGGLATLRGAPIDSASPDSGDALKKAIESTPLERDFTQQPPLVSHAVDNYPVTKNFNKCLDCHSWENYRKEKATKVSQTHFQSAGGQDLANISPRRYFCLQCHVPQVDAKPLVASTYQRPSAR